MAATKPFITLLDLCDELLLHILAFLEIPELLACSRACHTLRSLAVDPILHRHRLIHASLSLSHALLHRPPLSSLRPPMAIIYLTPTLSAARAISRSLISIRLSRQLSKRPSASSLVECNILPEECLSGARGAVSPQLVGVKRGLERERVKDGLRGWLKGRVRGEMERRMKAGEKEQGKTVKGMVRRFASVAGRGGCRAESLWGKGAGEKRKGDEPARARVLGLRRYWEGVGREGQAV